MILCVLSVLIVTCVNLSTAGNAGHGGSGSWPALPAKSPLLEELRLKTRALQINPLWTTDKNLARMIVETGYRVNKALRRLRRTASFRARVKADQLPDWTPAEHFTSNLPYECSGYTNDGSPVFLFPFGRWDTPKFLEVGRPKELYMYVIKMLEDARAKITSSTNPKTGEPVDQAMFIIDAKGYSIKKLLSIRATWALVRAAYAIDRHYPFLVTKWYVVNSPFALQIFWRLVRLVVSPTLERAVDIYTPYNTRGANALAHNLPKHAIPVSLGGTYLPKYEQQDAPASSWSTGLSLSTWSSTARAPWSPRKPPPAKCVNCKNSINSPSYGPPPSPATITPGQYGPPSVPATKTTGYVSPKGPSGPTGNNPQVPEKPQWTEYSSGSAPFPPASTQSQYGAPILQKSHHKMVAPWEGYSGTA